MAEPFVGETRIFAGNYVPEGWKACDGSLLSISENELLYAVIGTTYGGNGQSNFAVPNLNNRIPVGQGAGPGLTLRTIGQQFGQEAVTLTTAQLPMHQHALRASSAPATQVTPGPDLALATTPVDFYCAEQTQGNPTTVNPMGPYVLSTSGAAQPHENRMPTMTLQYMIALNGLYPSQQ